MPVAPSIIAYVALGANLGDRAGSIGSAIDRLNADPAIVVEAVSSLLENPAVGGPPDSPAFLNGVARIMTTLSPGDLLRTLLEVERELGRGRSRKWDPRTIDLDLLLYGDQIIDELDLKVPHPRMHERAFVLGPLMELAPDLRHPVLGRPFSQLLAGIARDSHPPCPSGASQTHSPVVPFVRNDRAT